MKHLMLVFLLTFTLSGTVFSENQIVENHSLNYNYSVSDAGYIQDEIIVKFKENASSAQIKALLAKYKTKLLYISPYAGFARLRIGKRETVFEMVEQYIKEPIVEYAEPNYIFRALFMPNDEYYRYQWNLDSIERNGINAERAWDISTGAGVIVAVLDTGVAYEDYGRYKLAPDLANTSFVAGYDFVNDDTHPNDDNGHGTHIAGTIAENTNNGIGVAGVAFDASIMPVKVLNRWGEGDTANVADGVYYAVKEGAQVINLSLGSSYPSITIKRALAFAYNSGVTVVAAAGNQGAESGGFTQEGRGKISYPAAYDAYCIAVGATRYDGMRAPYSNTGAYLDLVAPGGDIRVDQNSDGYGGWHPSTDFSKQSGGFQILLFPRHIDGCGTCVWRRSIAHRQWHRKSR